MYTDERMDDSNQRNDEDHIRDAREADNSLSLVGDAGVSEGDLTAGRAESIYIRAEIEGPGEEVLARLTGTVEQPYEYEELQPVVEDLTRLLETIERTGGGIRSSVAAETDVRASDEGVRHMLELLREYGLVTLEGNTWRLGPVFD